MNETALITGGGQRLGKAMGLALAKAGVNLVVHYFESKNQAEELVMEASSYGVKACSVQANLLLENDLQELVPRAFELIGTPLTILINNASIFEYDNLENATFESWDRHLNSNLRAPLFLTQAFAKQAPKSNFDENGERLALSNVINIVDQRVKKLTPEFMTYSIAKMGLWSLTQTAAQALAPHIRVNAIGPGPTLKGRRQSSDHFATQRESTILRRGASPDDISFALMYLLKSPGVTGQLICVDGGQHLAWETPDVLGLE